MEPCLDYKLHNTSIAGEVVSGVDVGRIEVRHANIAVLDHDELDPADEVLVPIEFPIAYVLPDLAPALTVEVSMSIAGRTHGKDTPDAGGTLYVV